MQTASPVFDAALAALAADQVTGKLAAIDQLAFALGEEAFAGEGCPVPPAPCFSPPPRRGVPERPVIVAAEDVPQRKPNSPEGKAALLHAITHIEFTAIDLALDHAMRFPGLPADYYSDWFGVAIEEARHFSLLRARLTALGSDYGDFPAHDSLWRMAMRTAHDPLARMALVPRLLEARGLDATPPIQKKLAAAGDHESVAVLDVILADEVGHVGLGDRWFRYLCAERGLDAEGTYRSLITEHGGPWPQAPMNREARQRAGFSAAELDALAAEGTARRSRAA